MKQCSLALAAALAGHDGARTTEEHGLGRRPQPLPDNLGPRRRKPSLTARGNANGRCAAVAAARDARGGERAWRHAAPAWASTAATVTGIRGGRPGRAAPQGRLSGQRGGREDHVRHAADWQLPLGRCPRGISRGGKGRLDRLVFRQSRRLAEGSAEKARHELEIVPDPLPREHGRYRESEKWRFLVRFNGQPLPGQPVTLETEFGTRTSFTTDAAGFATVLFPRDFKPAGKVEDHGRTLREIRAHHREGE